jgi:hypothetical protein
MGKVEVAAAVLSWYRAMITEAEAISLLCATEHAESAASNLRSLCEAWLQLRYTLKCATDPNDAARRARTFALLEFHDYLLAKGAIAAELKLVTDEIAAVRALDPIVVAELEKGRATTGPARLKYWSGKGPTGLIADVQRTIDPLTRLSDYYKLASWDAHQVMAPALNASLDPGPPPRLRLKAKLEPAEDAMFFEAVALYFLQDGYSLIASYFDWPPLPVDEADTSRGEVF